MASFNKFRNNGLRDAILVPLVNSFASIFAGFVVFSILGFLSMAMNVSVEEVTTADSHDTFTLTFHLTSLSSYCQNTGPALAFVTYPQALALLPLPSLWSVLFFLMLFFLGIDSAFVQMEATVVSIIDAFPNLRTGRGWVSLSVCISIFVTSLACCTEVSLIIIIIVVVVVFVVGGGGGGGARVGVVVADAAVIVVYVVLLFSSFPCKFSALLL
ncbi:Sodium- and chloride-dependent glycine transporter 2 [Portunus trituberculatus]|uniref:Sodium-and chloride-dependent glycine transporter 2 n=1 Tax=Portunus trituberculatus TaxID=210409 RepID=A0A5B7IQH8_PORTR|nr:Sodium- and chloride-dependent glycine transporter 2 [Portunus trituberculatus]